jgi:flagellin
VNSVVSISNSVVRNQAVFDLGRSARQQAKSITRIASGSRLADTSEDPGAYAVSLKLKLTANALDGVERGLLNAVSFLQAQEDGLLAVGRAVERMSELATLVQDPTKGTGDQAAILLEMDALREEIIRVQDQTLNGQKLFLKFDGDNGDTGGSLGVPSGPPGQQLDLTRADFSAGDAGFYWIYAISAGGVTSSTVNVADFGQAGFDTLLQSVSSMLAQNGAEQSRVQSALDQARTRRIHTEAADGRISDVDVAREVTRLSRTNIQMDATRSVMAQANVLAEIALKILSG